MVLVNDERVGSVPAKEIEQVLEIMAFMPDISGSIYCKDNIYGMRVYLTWES